MGTGDGVEFGGGGGVQAQRPVPRLAAADALPKEEADAVTGSGGPRAVLKIKQTVQLR